jgi:hypothetical protein
MSQDVPLSRLGIKRRGVVKLRVIGAGGSGVLRRRLVPKLVARGHE